MISFRYHIVSLVAVFLALAARHRRRHHRPQRAGHPDLRNQVERPQERPHASWPTQVKTLQGEVDTAGQFATTFGASWSPAP